MSKYSVASLRVFGAVSFVNGAGQSIDLGAKQQALIVLLATAANGSRTRSWIQSMLWGNVQQAQASGSLRAALANIRRLIGDDHKVLIDANRDRITLKIELIDLLGSPDDGEFAEGLDVKYEEGFNDWLRETRASYRSQRNQPVTEPAAKSFNPDQSKRIASLLPRIAVLPFSQRNVLRVTALGDSIAEEISRTLSRTHVCEVISHLSTREISQQDSRSSASLLGAHYYLAGELVEINGQYQISLDFHHFDRGTLLWSREHIGNVQDYLQGDNSLPREVARGVVQTVMHTSEELGKTMPLPQLSLHEALVSAIALMHGPSAQGPVQARRILAQVIERAPAHPIPHAWLAKTHILGIQRGSQIDQSSAAELVAEATDRALEIDPQCSMAHSFAACATSHFKRDYDQAEQMHNEALSLDPNNAFSWILKSTCHAFRDEGAEAVRSAMKAMRLSPCDPQAYFFETLTATAHIAAERYSVALEYAERSLAKNSAHPSTHRARVIALQRLGRDVEAHRAAQELLNVEPDLTLRKYLNRHPAANFRTGRDWAHALGAAGIPAN